MEIKQDIFVHNKFEVEVKDAVTGETKQTAVGYNVITNKYFEILLSNSTSHTSHYFFTYISIGSGSGTPSASDTSLFTYIGRETTTDLETVYAYPTSHMKKQIILDVDSYNGYTITEVGFSANDLYTHAMLQDSEGQQIAISKTNTDVVYITATFYCTYTAGGFGNNGIYPTADKNALIKWVFAKGWNYYNASGTRSDKLYLRSFPKTLTTADELETKYLTSKEYNIYHNYSSSIAIGTGDTTAMTMTLSNATFGSTEGGTGQLVGCFGFPDIGAFNFPDSSVLVGYNVQGQTIGTGDGTTTDFSLGAPFIKSGSLHIYINDVEKTEGTDFTADYESNSTKTYSAFCSAGLSALKDTTYAKFGDMADRSATSSSSGDPIAFSKYGGSKIYPQNVQVTAAKPIWLDFQSAKTCNYFEIKPSISESYRDAVVIEYSSDNETWTAVTYTRSEQIYTWSDISARYWRIYITNYTWSCNLSSAYTVDGISTHTVFFLGKYSPAIHFATAPADGDVITASYQLDRPYKTVNNLMRMTIVISLQRG